MRKAALIPLLLVALVLAGCGGGSGSSSRSTTSASTAPKSAGGPEAAWAKEVQAVMTRFENHISARMVEQISTTSSKLLLEPLYRSWSGYLAGLAKELEATNAPAACASARQKIAGYADEVSALAKKLGEQPHLSERAYSVLVFKQGEKISAVGRKLSSFTAAPTC